MEIMQSEDMNLTTTNVVLNNILEGVEKQFVDVNDNALSSYSCHAVAINTNVRNRDVALNIDCNLLPVYYTVFEAFGKSCWDMSVMQWWGY